MYFDEDEGLDPEMFAKIVRGIHKASSQLLEKQKQESAAAKKTTGPAAATPFTPADAARQIREAAAEASDKTTETTANRSTRGEVEHDFLQALRADYEALAARVSKLEGRKR